MRGKEHIFSCFSLYRACVKNASMLQSKERLSVKENVTDVNISKVFQKSCKLFADVLE